MMDKEKKDFIITRAEWGVVIGIGWALIMACLKPGSFFEFQALSLKMFFQYSIVGIPVFAIGGALEGIFMYKRKKKSSG